MARRARELPHVDRPIFIVAPHRSGTTLLYRLLAEHPDVGFYNPANRRWRNFPRLAHLRTRLGGADKAVEEIVEAEPFGELSLKGFPRAIPALNILRLKRENSQNRRP